MIKGKYQVIDTLKQNEYKRVDRCAKNDGGVIVAKSYIKQESRLAQN